MATQQSDDTGTTGDLRERSLPELLSRLSEETTRLVHQELDLAKVELTQKGRQAGAGAGLFGAAAAVAAVLALRGRDKVKQAAPPMPEQTIETVMEDVKWAKTQTRSAKR